MPQAGLDPTGEKWQLCLNIVVALPPKSPRLDIFSPSLHNEMTGHEHRIISMDFSTAIIRPG